MEAHCPCGLDWVLCVLTEVEELGSLWIRPGFCGGHHSSYDGFSSPMKFICDPFPSQEEIFLTEGLVEGFNAPLYININTSQRFLGRIIHLFVQKCFDYIFFNTE